MSAPSPSTSDGDLAALEARARRRVALRMGFYIHALVYTVVNLGLFAINTATGGVRWSHFPLWGWGLGLAIHGTVVLFAIHGDGLRARMLANEMERLRRQGR